MLARRIFVFSLAVVLVARTLHCCYVGATLCAGAAMLSSDASAPADDNRLPLTNPDDRDPNETGCICKGVVQTPSVFEAVRPSLDRPDLLSEPAAAREQVADAGDAAHGLRDRHLLGPPPLGGRALRAWVGSLLI